MSIIRNIAVLDVRNIKEEVAKELTALENIGLLLETGRSQGLLAHARKSNIAANLKLEDNIDMVMKNGSFQVDNDYLKYLYEPIMIVTNGSLEFKNDVDIDILAEKVKKLIVNGKLIAPKKLTGLLDVRGTINGSTISYDEDETYIDRVKINNSFLNQLEKKSKLAINNLILVDEIDLALLEEKIESIRVIGKLVVLEKNEELIKDKIKDYYSLDKEIIPSYKDEVILLEKNTEINDQTIRQYDRAYIYSNKTIEIKLNDLENLEEYIEYIVAKEVILSEENYEKMKDIIVGDTKIEIFNGKFIKNLAYMSLSKEITESTAIKNLGALEIKKDIDRESFKENLEYIDNLGVIMVDKEVADLVNSKLRKNLGALELIDSDSEEKEDKKEDVMYENMAELIL